MHSSFGLISHAVVIRLNKLASWFSLQIQYGELYVLLFIAVFVLFIEWNI